MSSAPIDKFLAEFLGFIGKFPTPQKCIGAGQMLSRDEAETIMKSSSKLHLTDMEKEQYILGVVDTLSSSEVENVIKKAAQDAYHNASLVFTELTLANMGLALFDIMHDTQFAPRVIPMISVSIVQYLWDD